MSAATEELLLQIIELETAIQENASCCKDVSVLQERLIFLREKFHALNENLKKNSELLKG
jgi:hypothetical protein